jgi:hypothetical protein
VIRASRRVVVVVLAGVALIAFGAPSTSASATSPSITKADFIAKADKICAAGSAKLAAAEAKLGKQPTDKQMETYLVKVYVPNIAGQIAKIRKLGLPAGDETQLQALFAEAGQVLAKIKADPAAALASSTSPFADVSAKQQAYGFKVCGGAGGSSSGDAVTSAAQRFVGHYQGPWNNTTFGSSGTVDLAITLNAPARTLMVVTTLTGQVFGAPAPPPETLTVPLDASDPAKPVTVPSPTFGPLTLSLASDGSLTLDAPTVPSANASTFHMVLRPSATGMNGTYTVGLRSGTTANGTVTLQKAAAPGQAAASGAGAAVGGETIVWGNTFQVLGATPGPGCQTSQLYTFTITNGARYAGQSAVVVLYGPDYPDKPRQSVTVGPAGTFDVPYAGKVCFEPGSATGGVALVSVGANTNVQPSLGSIPGAGL